MSQPSYLACGFALCLAAFSGLVLAQSLPASHKGPTGVTYFSGGIGTDETRAIRDDARHHSLALEFLERQGKGIVYSSGEQVTITDEHARIVVQADSEGPLMMVDLPVGSYQVKAANDGRSQSKAVEISSAGHAHETFLWEAR
jgi:hypothetical protein